MKIEFYDYTLPNESLKNGIYFYGEKILFGWEKDLGTRSYDFHVAVYDEKFGLLGICDRSLGEETLVYERINFIHTCDLKNYEVKMPPTKFREEGYSDFNWEKLVKEACPELLDYAEERLKRKHSNKIVEKTEFPGMGTNFYGKGEFLEFTEKSASCWAGPFELNNKRGASLNVRKYELKKEIKIVNPTTDYSFYDLPTDIQNDLTQKHKVHAANIVYGWTKDEKLAFFNELTDNQRYSTVKRFYSIRNSYLDEQLKQDFLPFKIYMCGTDDCSYSNWFGTEEEVNKELEYLRKMQPLDFTKDIRDRGYIFTN